MINISNLISQLEPSALTEILLESKMPTDVFLLSVTGESFTPERRIPGEINMRSPAMSPPRKDPTPNQDSK